jgi:hypothetical protein
MGFGTFFASAAMGYGMGAGGVLVSTLLTRGAQFSSTQANQAGLFMSCLFGVGSVIRAQR